MAQMVGFLRASRVGNLKIIGMWQCNAEKAGVDRKTLQRIKARIRKNGTINIKTGAVKRLLAILI
jgi:hypothetical protein